ncbi:MAG: hypothetical protein KY447_05775 [Actinobacteria bacterium]|nr:hypothetical protein [Actinomycetota bacterium]
MIVVGSVRSSGATTLAMALAGWLERALLVEADPDGGVLALRYGLSREPGLVTLAAARQLSAEGVFAHAQPLPGGLVAVPAPESPERVSHLLHTTGARLGSLLAGLAGVAVVVDAGRLGPSSPASCLVPAAAATVLVARPRAEELVAGAERVGALAAMGARVGMVLVGSGPYRAEEVATHLRCPVLGTIADDPAAARTLAQGGSGKALARSALARSARALAASLVAGPSSNAVTKAASAPREAFA